MEVVRIKDCNTGSWTPKTTRDVNLYLITPALAKRMLEFRRNQRPLKKTRIEKMALDLLEGEWQLTNQGLGFSTEGALLDGQHRLHAIIEADTPAEMQVTFGIDPKAFMVIDTGGVRSVSDLVAIKCQGLKHVSSVTAVARAALIGVGDPMHLPDRDTVVELVYNYQEPLVDLVATFTKQPAWARPGPIIASFFNAMRPDDQWAGGHGNLNPAVITPLVMRFVTMDWAGASDPMKILYQRIIRMRDIDKKTASSEKERVDLYRITTAAIRSDLSGEGISKLQQSTTEWGASRDRVARKITRGKAPRAEAAHG